MKIGAVIVTYNPNIERLKKNINSLIDQVCEITLVDNGSKNINQIVKLVRLFDRVHVKRLNQNYGIAAAQNVGFRFFNENHYKWVLNLDQDTVLGEKYVRKLCQKLLKLTEVGIITGAYIDSKWSPTQIQEVRNERFENVESVDQEISSGNIVNIQAWSDVGGFDETLFIDYVDFDFDYKLIEHGYSIYRVNDVEFIHEIGDPIKKNWLSKILFLRGMNLFDHSPERLFYLNRNRIVVRRRHPQFGSPVKVFIREVINLRQILVMSSPRLPKFYKSVSGILHGLFFE